MLSAMLMSFESMVAKTYCQDDTIICASIFYEQGSSDYNPDLRENALTIDKLLTTIGDGRITEISIVSSASPEGNTAFNYTLSDKRNQTALNLVKDLTGFNHAHKNISSLGTDWIGLADKIEKSEMQFAVEAAALIRHTPEWIKKDSIVVDGRKLRLRLLHENRPWQYMEEYIFPDLRVSHIRIAYNKAIAKISTPISYAIEPLSILPPCNLDSLIGGNIQNVRNNRNQRIIASIRTNLLYDIAAIPNLNVELIFHNGWAVGIGGMYAWWDKKDMTKVWRIQNAEFQIKKYIGITPPHFANCWHIGCYANICRYDILWEKKGFLSGNSNSRFFNRPSWIVGFECGYSLHLSNNFNLNFSVGIGYLTGQYLTYKSEQGHNIWESTRIRHWIGPTKAEVSLVWLIWKGGGR